ncbi:MAG: hypothetical protein L0287_32770 [Anaerolineae bacterium]|nr:hypothetical protein [Anaerolineae bacterium]
MLIGFHHPYLTRSSPLFQFHQTHRSCYRVFDYKKAKPNRFAARMKNEPLIDMIEPDVAKVFKSSEQRNNKRAT